MFLRNVDIYLQIHMALQPGRPTSTSLSSLEPQISYNIISMYVPAVFSPLCLYLVVGEANWSFCNCREFLLMIYAYGR
jgi:hypothetical protein